MIVTSLTTKCSIVVIEKDDFIQINKKKYYFTIDYTDLNSQTFILLLNSLIQESGVTSEVDEAGRIVFSSDTAFTINSASYNIIQISGLYSQVLPIPASYNEQYEIIAESVGNILSTPVLYLLSNVGKSSYRNLNETINISKIVLRINNSFSANFPIIVSNADFGIELNSNDLSHLQLTLVDANLHEVHLLNPLYITISVQGLPDDNLFAIEQSESNR
ncbi:DNA methyltransferase [Histomonas meleagridis]|uniref:DNA methyltransferase n=1 Tax=Histomonas meleagridis TaxID=135588 RepID=UPI003559DD51|nr:DNA methyltransferase [Histomonas meleagridis]KAH0801949.1 DNA methyltransferase [Histomonas meleagridis]